MSYVKDNKLAWEESFENRKQNWGEDNYIRLKNEKLPFFNADMKAELEKIDFRGKTVAQFCCNNGRELLSLMGLGVSSAVGFDIAENIIAQAKDTATKADIQNCEFVACNILDIPDKYHGQFDILLLTVGAICWFEDLNPFFNMASKCLKDNGILIINEIHPFENMLPVPGEEAFDASNLNKFAYSYFRKEPWIENSGMGYISGEFKSKTFTSFSHTLSDIINALSANGLKTTRLQEYDYDIGLTDVYDNKGFPLSLILIAEK
ncbi:MAG: class I SAM-dependent methyltransferase [Defluviitaleaceae bacterium]|nr:class I SAM-dependent methyltransferase [Defluviitaleaceae bacterium]